MNADFCKKGTIAIIPISEANACLSSRDDPVIAVDDHFQLKDVGATAEGFKATNRDA